MNDDDDDDDDEIFLPTKAKLKILSHLKLLYLPYQLNGTLAFYINQSKSINQSLFLECTAPNGARTQKVQLQH